MKRLGCVLDPTDVYEDIQPEIAYPHALKWKSRIFVYYALYSDEVNGIALSVSHDGIHFNHEGIVLPVNEELPDETFGLSYIATAIYNSKLHMLYVIAGYDYALVYLAVSRDGIHFTKLGRTDILPEDGNINHAGAYLYGLHKINRYFVADSELFFNNEYWIMRFISRDTMHWRNLGIVKGMGGSGEIDEYWMGYPAVHYYNKRLFTYYYAVGELSVNVALAVSKPLMSVHKLGAVWYAGEEPQQDQFVFDSLSFIPKDSYKLAYYTNYDLSYQRIFCAAYRDFVR
jgi:hypothetical protein